METKSSPELDELIKLLQQYAAGKLDLTTLKNNTISSSQSKQANQSPVSSSGIATAANPAGVSNSFSGVSPSLAGNLGNLASALSGNPAYGQAGAAYGLTQGALSEANRPIGFASLAASLGNVPGLGTAAGLASMGVNGFSAAGILGLLGATVNPAFGLAGIANSLTGNPLGRVGETLAGRTVPNSSYAEQIGNAVNNSQIGYDQDSMQNLVDSIQAESAAQTENSALGGYETDSGSGGSSNSSSANNSGTGTGNASQSGAGASQTSGDNRSSY